MKKSPPTIKGIFVMSHVNALAKAKGEKAVQKLVERSGHRVHFGNNDNVPISVELLIIQHALDMLAGNEIEQGKREFEAGRFHFRNFAETPLGEMVLLFNFKTVLLRATWIARRVFRGMEFSSKSLGKNHVQITIGNSEYPLEHFQGFFKAWMQYLKLKGSVKATAKDGDHIYTIKWS